MPIEPLNSIGGGNFDTVTSTSSWFWFFINSIEYFVKLLLSVTLYCEDSPDFWQKCSNETVAFNYSYCRMVSVLVPCFQLDSQLLIWSCCTQQLETHTHTHTPQHIGSEESLFWATSPIENVCHTHLQPVTWGAWRCVCVCVTDIFRIWKAQGGGCGVCKQTCSLSPECSNSVSHTHARTRTRTHTNDWANSRHADYPRGARETFW